MTAALCPRSNPDRPLYPEGGNHHPIASFQPAAVADPPLHLFLSERRQTRGRDRLAVALVFSSGVRSVMRGELGKFGASTSRAFAMMTSPPSPLVTRPRMSRLRIVVEVRVVRDGVAEADADGFVDPPRALVARGHERSAPRRVARRNFISAGNSMPASWREARDALLGEILHGAAAVAAPLVGGRIGAVVDRREGEFVEPRRDEPSASRSPPATLVPIDMPSTAFSPRPSSPRARSLRRRSPPRTARRPTRFADRKRCAGCACRNPPATRRGRAKPRALRCSHRRPPSCRRSHPRAADAPRRAAACPGCRRSDTAGRSGNTDPTRPPRKRPPRHRSPPRTCGRSRRDRSRSGSRRDAARAAWRRPLPAGSSSSATASTLMARRKSRGPMNSQSNSRSPPGRKSPRKQPRPPARQRSARGCRLSARAGISPAARHIALSTAACSAGMRQHGDRSARPSHPCAPKRVERSDARRASAPRTIGAIPHNGGHEAGIEHRDA